jgi:hypothetical protein
MKKSDMTKAILSQKVSLIERLDALEKTFDVNAQKVDKNFQQAHNHDLALGLRLHRLEVRVERLELPLRVRAWRRIFGEPKPKAQPEPMAAPKPQGGTS